MPMFFVTLRHGKLTPQHVLSSRRCGVNGKSENGQRKLWLNIDMWLDIFEKPLCTLETSTYTITDD